MNPHCQRPGCTGTIEDGYCNVCGLAMLKSSTTSQKELKTFTGRSSSVTTGTGSSPLTNRSRGSRRTSPTSGRSSRKQLGAGLVSIPELPSTEPEKLILTDPKVPENKRFCGNCNNPLRREKGFCSKCGQKYSFIPTLNGKDLIAGQYEVKGAIAYGGLGWIYLGFDNTLSRYIVLKGLLNSEDAASAAVAVAERKFLAAVKHANIVGIYNFVNHGTEGFIVMEYVGGKTLKQIRKERGLLPVAEAIAYIHRILGAFAYLHTQGLVYCDFKPDNIMLEGNDVKLIDMGGVRRIDDPEGDIYGTVGYSAPEVAEVGPTVVSDLYTVGRTLAVLLCDIKGFGSTHQYSLPSPQEEPLFAQQESLYRFLLKATAENPDDRFQSADEMADQLLGVLREVVALETGTPRPATSTLFGGDLLPLTAANDFTPISPEFYHLPIPLLDATDPAFNAVVNASAITDLNRRIESLTQITNQFPQSKEAQLRLANSLIDLGGNEKRLEKILAQVEENDPWDWRILWYRGRSLMAAGKAQEAKKAFDQVYFDLPGEVAPKLALGLAAEKAGDFPFAIQMYGIVLRTDPGYVSAAFGLARCLVHQNNPHQAVTALEQVPQSSSLFTRSRVEVARILTSRDKSQPGMNELKNAALVVEAIALEGMEHYQLSKRVLETALHLITTQALSPTSTVTILGQPLEEIKLRLGLEKVLRSMAHLTTGDDKILLVDEANRVRPRTLL
ncbi:MAG TPA: serine/threonine protein kinase [Cyanobacteria bacterium UBA8803]|nr:serine/threonine protein kinase [Cyanobacteria bacterium UBA9273]HBL58930.1 serine/threonine protein kinase [Cyanobacteria bacterium UBA8803]